MLAAENGTSEVVRLLLEHGAKISSGEKGGITALDYVKDNKHPDAHKIEALLRQYSAK